jgi:hypothetical protein
MPLDRNGSGFERGVIRTNVEVTRGTGRKFSGPTSNNGSTTAI